MSRFSADFTGDLYDAVCDVLDEAAETAAYYAARPGLLERERRQRELDDHARDNARFAGRGPCEVDE